MSADPQQAIFEGWAVVEMMGHRKEIGYVTTQAFGQAVLFRIDTPNLPEREFVLEAPESAHLDSAMLRQWCPAGTKVKRAAVPARSCLVAPSSLYAINPCSEEVARHQIERSISRPLIVVELPPDAKQLPAYEPDAEDNPGELEDDEFLDGDEEAEASVEGLQ